MSSTVRNGNNYFTNHIVGSYRKIENGLLGATKLLGSSVGVSNLKDLALLVDTWKLGKCCTVATSALQTAPSVIKGVLNYGQDSIKTVTAGAAILSTALGVQKFISENLVFLLVKNEPEAEVEPTSNFGMVAIAVTGACVTLIASRAMAELISRGDIASLSKKVAVISSGLLTSSVVSSAANHLLTAGIGPQPRLGVQLACSATPALLSSLILTTPEELGMPLLIPMHLLGPTLVYALSEACPLELRAALLVAIAGHQLLEHKNAGNSRELEGSALCEAGINGIATYYLGQFLGHAIRPGLVASTIGSGVTSSLYSGALEVVQHQTENGSHSTEEAFKFPQFNKAKSDYVENLAKTEKANQELWVANVEKLVGEKVPAVVTSMIMDYVDEDNFDRIKWPEVNQQIEELLVPAGLLLAEVNV